MKWENRERFYAKLRKAVPNVEGAILGVNQKTGEAMVSLAQRLVPNDPPPDSGDLLRSIRLDRGPGPTSYLYQAGGALTTRDGYDYSLAQEFGTQKMPANPFFWPSYRVGKRGHKGRITRAVRKALRAAGFH